MHDIVIPYHFMHKYINKELEGSFSDFTAMQSKFWIWETVEAALLAQDDQFKSQLIGKPIEHYDAIGSFMYANN